MPRYQSVFWPVEQREPALGLPLTFVFCVQKWRPFCNEFEGKVQDFNFGTLLRCVETLSADPVDESSLMINLINVNPLLANVLVKMI